MRTNKLIISSAMVTLLSACGGTKHQTLGSLQYEKKEEKAIEYKKMDHKEVRAEYQELLNLFEDKQLKEQIERRIADVYMMEGVQKQESGPAKTKSYYLEAIKSYREILEKYPNSPDNAEVLYQLAKAYDMEGNQGEALKMLERLAARHPYYDNIAEAYFRMGDIYFSAQEYTKAEKAYTAVTNQGIKRYHINAHYMLGWTHYKQYRFRKSLSAFAYVLNGTLKNAEDIDKLGKAEKAMVRDALHSLSLAFDKEGGAEAIATISELAKKDFAWMLYEDLGDYYLKKELYEQSAESYRLYVRKFPNSMRAPGLHKKLVDTYIQGQFYQQALSEKESYVEAYGIYSSFPGKKGMREDIVPVVKTYLDELAQHHRSVGKDLIVSLEKKGKGQIPQKKRAPLRKEAMASLDKAAKFFQQYIDTFPNDEQIDKIRFQKAESLFDAERYEPAIQDYELVAYKPVGQSAKQEEAKAGYAALVCYQNVVSSFDEGSAEQKKWQAEAVESMLRFATKFDKDKRSQKVLTNAAEYMFSLNQYQRAVDITKKLIDGNRELDPNLKKTAYGIMAHSYFKLEQYQNAELSYLAQRKFIAAESEEYKEVTKLLATSIYKKAEQIEVAGDVKGAASELLRIKQLAPESEVRSVAQYDAVVLLSELKQWGDVIPEILELQSKFPKHKMAVDLQRQLAFAYEKNQQWDKAAEAYLTVSKKDPDAEKRRLALFNSANMNEKNKNHEEAIKQFKKYIYIYEEPFDLRMEARYHTAINYGMLGDIDKKQYWFRRIIDGDKNAGAKRTERSKWLSAWANLEYAKYFDKEFRNARLWLPLVKSLPKKQKLLQGAIQRYQASASYGLLEFVTQSSYRLGLLYQVFAKELRASRVPGGLSQEERGMYKQIIEEQAAPFDNLALEVHMTNVTRAWEGDYNPWIEKSYIEMEKIYPQRFGKKEVIVSYGDEIR